MRSPRLNVLCTQLWSVEVLGEVLLRHAEVLILKLLNPPLKGAVLVPELDQLGVDLIDGGDFGRDIHERSAAKLAVLGIAFLHDGFDLG